jgi:hypothetical protein
VPFIETEFKAIYQAKQSVTRLIADGTAAKKAVDDVFATYRNAGGSLEEGAFTTEMQRTL